MSKAKQLLGDYLAELEGGKAPRWSRSTTFEQRPDGSVCRKVCRADGTVEKEEVLSGIEWETIAARAGTGLSQAQFAKLLGVSVRTLQDWEQGRKTPSGAARTLLAIAARRPDVLKEVTLAL